MYGLDGWIYFIALPVCKACCRIAQREGEEGEDITEPATAAVRAVSPRQLGPAFIAHWRRMGVFAVGEFRYKALAGELGSVVKVRAIDVPVIPETFITAPCIMCGVTTEQRRVVVSAAHRLLNYMRHALLVFVPVCGDCSICPDPAIVMNVSRFFVHWNYRPSGQLESLNRMGIHIWAAESDVTPSTTPVDPAPIPVVPIPVPPPLPISPGDPPPVAPTPTPEDTRGGEIP